MNRYVLFVVILVLFTVNPFSLSANGSDPGNKKPDHTVMTVRHCIPLKELNLSEKQQEAINKINIIYREKILKLRYELTSEQIEIKDLLRDPAVSEKLIRSRGLKIESLQARLQREANNYQLEIRHILTPEQIRSWCTFESYPLKRGLKKLP